MPTLNTEQSLWSIAHGAGRKHSRADVKGKIKNLYNNKDIRSNQWGGKIICGEDVLAWEEVPEAYKSIESVVSDLENAGLITRIASFRPLITFKTSDSKTNEVRRDPKEWQQERRDARKFKESRF